MVDTGSITDVVTGGSSTGALQEVGSKLVEKIFGGILWFGIGVLVIGIIGYVGWYFLIYKKKFDIEVKIISERAEDKVSIYYDKAAILTDRKSGGKYLRLWSLKVELPAPKFNIFQVVGKKDYLELYRTAENKFYYLTPSIVNKKYVLKSDGKYYLMADQSKMMVDANDDFWRAKRKEQNKGMFSTESIFMKLLPYLPAIVGGIITIFILYVLMSHLPGILDQLGQLVEKLNQANGGNVPIPGA
jgi:hypothetical protein